MFSNNNNKSQDTPAQKALICRKVVLVGASGVGKTSIVARQSGQGFTTHVSPTIGGGFCKSVIELDDAVVELQIWDTAGQERFRSMAQMYYRNACAAFVVYDITHANSFAETKSWVNELNVKISEPVVLFLIGNKIDKKDREVTTAQGEEYASNIGAQFFETSAFSGSGIPAAFLALAERLVHDSNNQKILPRLSVELDNNTENLKGGGKSWKKWCTLI